MRTYLWQTNMDSRVCEICQKYNGKEFTADELKQAEEFVRMHHSVEEPCRCYSIDITRLA